MRKGEVTKFAVIQSIAPIFNRLGFAGTTLEELMRASGLRKGGVYHHFRSKEDLAIQAFEYSVQMMREYWIAAITREPDAAAQLRVIIDTFEMLFDDSLIAGGCPLMNAALDSDDAYPWLKEKTRAAFDDWRCLIASIVRKGVAAGRFRPETDADGVAWIMISALEGGLALSRLNGDLQALKSVSSHLGRYIAAELICE
ncbi:hypothetical protein CCAX7_63890 [Capsulimonas corticalis]|uniref:Uncharacterized protein n=1 Tax=Capsulimonas corticalis TaxID=2219043 RepID=A0A402CX14_9BACT|nr:TetR/AcrR family transcriptional regulator [Capsulimonas corticalis]BDI34338.1 hypothetical protein CCAX7_63890 [Capsulimonas corticalis]